MKILMISPQFHPIVGGYERAAERLSCALVDRGHEVTVVTERRNRDWAQHEHLQGVHVRRLWCIHKSHMHTVTSATSLALYLLREGRRYDVWHIHQYGISVAIASVLGFLMRRPVLVKLTSSSGMGIGNVLRGNFLKILHRRVDGVAAVSRETVREAVAFGIPAERVHLLGNGVDTDNYFPRSFQERANLLSELGLVDKKLVIYVGRLSPEKNPDGLLSAWAQARSRLSPNWVLAIVGDGPMKVTLENTANRLGISDSVFFAGHRTNVEAWLGASEVYVSPSHWEGLSNTLLEAMASGLPAIVTRVSGVQELVEEARAGIVIPVRNSEALCEALVSIVKDEKLRLNLGEAARRVILARYSITSVALAYEALYNSLILENKYGSLGNKHGN